MEKVAVDLPALSETLLIPLWARALERYDDRIRYDGQWSYFDYCPARWRYLRLLGPFAWVRAT